MAPSLLKSDGASTAKPSRRYAGIHVSKALHGLVTNRFAFQDPSTFIVERFYGGYQDCLLGTSSNVEVSPRNTWITRPGITQYTTFQFPTPPLGSYSFNQNGVFTLYVDTATEIYTVTPTTGTSVFTKGAGAGQTSFLQLGGTTFFADGVDNKKIINGTIWNWGVVAPTGAPGVTVAASGSAASIWTMDVTYTTMGFLTDSNGNIQQLVSVNANPAVPNTSTTIGISSSGQPGWSSTPGATTTESTGTPITWTNWGPIVAWAANKVFNNASVGGTNADPCIIYDPVSKSCYIQASPSNAQGTTGTTKPAFTGAFASVFHDGSVKWFCLGTPKTPPLWTPSTFFSKLGTVSDNDGGSGISQPLTPAAAGIGGAHPQVTFWQVAATASGESGTGGVAPNWATVAGNLTPDNQLAWLCLGSSAWAANTSYIPWANSPNAIFSVIQDSNNNYQVCVSPVGATSISGGTQPTWETAYGANTTDGTVTWVCVGAKLEWSTATKWFLPTIGFTVPSPTDPYGGSEIKDSNGNIQIAINNGLSGSTEPTWATATGVQTPDGAGNLNWINNGSAAAQTLVITAGFGYGYAFKARTPTDFFVTNIPNGLNSPLGPPTGSGDGSISSMSPPFKMPTASNPGAVVQLTGKGSTDPQVDTIVIFRSEDGFQGGPYFELTEIPNPAVVNGMAGTWNFSDYFPDVDLDNLIEGDTVGQNAPPPVGLTNICYTQGRVWGSVLNVEFASSGNDIPPDNGNGLTGWNASNNFPLTSPVTANIAVNSGILAYTTTDEWSILGGPEIPQFFPAVTRAGVGLLSRNAITQLGAEIALFSADRRLLMFIPGQGETEPGLGIADQFSEFDPSKVYLTLYENGLDKGIFLADGSTGWFRLEAHSWPNNDPVWSPFATITGGCQMVQSIQTAPGVRSLLIGGTSTNQTIAFRDVSVNSDKGTPYASNFTVGGIPLTHDGEMAELGFITFTGPRIGSAPIVSYLLDETSGDYTTMPTYVSDPPLLYGANGQPTSVYRNRYYFKQSAPNVATITNTSANGTEATITADNDYDTGDEVTIVGTTNGTGAFNGTFSILAANSTSFRFALLQTISSAADTGTATVLVAPPPVWCTDILVNVAFDADGAQHEMARFTIFGGIYEDPND